MTAAPTFLAPASAEAASAATHDETLPLSALVEHAPRASVNGRELERLVGVSLERVRTWRRRFDFPETIDSSTGTRRFYVDDLPRILAVSQLIGAGMPVAEAIARVRAGMQVPDLSHLVQTFGGLDAPVVAVHGPEPLALLWANDAAHARAALHETAIVAPGQASLLYRPLQHLIAGKRAGAMLVQHPSWTAPGVTARSLAWSIGAPAFTPAIAVMIELPAADVVETVERGATPRAPEPVEGVDRGWCSAIAAARRSLQREAGAAALDGAVSQLVDHTPATDAFVLHEGSSGLICARSAHGRIGPSNTPTAKFRELAGASSERPSWLPPAASEYFTGDRDAPCLAVPMMSAGRRNGFIVLEFSERPTLSDDVEQLLIGLATAASVSLARDRTRALRRKLADEAAATGRADAHPSS